MFRFIASRMPKSYVEVGCSNRNVMGKNISFCILANRVKKKARWGKWVQAMRHVKCRWQPLVSKGDLCIHFLKILLQDRIFSNSQNPRRLQNAAKALLKCHNYPEPQRTTVAIPGKLQAVVTPYNIYMVHRKL